MPDTLHIDFETRSTVDLRKTGADKYAADPATDIWCMGFAFGDGPVDIIERTDLFGYGLDIGSHVESGGIVVAHNAAFELAIWNRLLAPRYGWPELKPEQCRCTMAMAYAMALPGALDNAAAAVGLQNVKDSKGHRLMLQMCKPRKVNEDGTIIWWDDEDRLNRLYDYCRQDVEVERELEKRLLPLSDSEQALWVLDQKINQRGVYVDVATIEKAKVLVSQATKILNAEMNDVTGGFVSRCSNVNDLTQFLRANDVETPGVAKADLAALLKQDDLPADCRRAIELRREAAKSSTAKLNPMMGAAMDDQRVRGMFQYHGASTGRWAGRRIQLHNLPRPALSQRAIEEVIEILEG